MLGMRSHATMNQHSKPRSPYTSNTAIHTRPFPIWKWTILNRKKINGNTFETTAKWWVLHYSTGDGRVTTDFETTPLVSTYLIAFIVSDFGYVEFNATDDNPTKQRVYANKDYVNQAEYALAEGVSILNAIAKYVQVPFSLEKMDQAAIPQFRAGGLNLI